MTMRWKLVCAGLVVIAIGYCFLKGQAGG